MRLHALISEVTKSLEAYELDKATRPIGEFVDDLSTWYLRRSRERIKSENLDEKEPALATLSFVLGELAKIMAPFTPFFAEYLYGKLTTNNSQPATQERSSVHLENWPITGRVDDKVLKEMEEVRKIVSLALEARAKVNIKVRQPLAKLKVKSLKFNVSKGLTELITDEVNVKDVVVDESLATEVELDTTMTFELKEEGMFRELARFLQEMRKKLGYKAGEQVTFTVGAQGPSRRFIEQHEQELARIASLKNILMQDTLEGGELFVVGELSVRVSLSRN